MRGEKAKFKEADERNKGISGCARWNELEL